MRPVLVLLNGLPASGKSTLARECCERAESALPLALDIDLLRGMLGGWRRTPVDAGLAARAVALAAIGTHLRAGHDVVVPQYLRRHAFIDQLADVAARSGAAFLEGVLLVDSATAAERLTARSAEAVARGRTTDEGDLAGPMDAVEDDFERFLATRPNAILLESGPTPLVEQLSGAITLARGA